MTKMSRALTSLLIWEVSAGLCTVPSRALANVDDSNLPLQQAARRVLAYQDNLQWYVLMVVGSGLLGLAACFLVCKWCFRTAPVNSLRRRWIGTIYDPVKAGEARLRAVVSRAELPRTKNPEASPLEPKKRQPLLDWAKRQPHWLAKCESVVEVLPRLADDSPKKAKLIEHLREVLTPRQEHAPHELLERAKLCQHCRKLWPDEGWPLLFELACRHWARDEVGTNRVFPAIRQRHLAGMADHPVVEALGEVLLARGRFRDARSIYLGLSRNGSLADRTETIANWAESAAARSKVADSQISNFGQQIDSIKQRATALQIS